jgi:hypothetical protein
MSHSGRSTVPVRSRFVLEIIALILARFTQFRVRIYDFPSISRMGSAMEGKRKLLAPLAWREKPQRMSDED